MISVEKHVTLAQLIRAESKFEICVDLLEMVNAAGWRSIDRGKKYKWKLSA